jgi:hypothetical protein
MVLVTTIRILLALAFLGCTAYRKESSRFTKLDLSLVYSYTHLSSSSIKGLRSQNPNRAEMSVSCELEPWLGVVADLGLGSDGNRSSSIVGTGLRSAEPAYLWGPCLVIPLGRTTPFFQVLIGVTHSNVAMFDTSSRQTEFTWALDGGFDYRLTPHFVLRPLELEFLRTNFFAFQDNELVQNDFRASTGIVFRF